MPRGVQAVVEDALELLLEELDLVDRSEDFLMSLIGLRPEVRAAVRGACAVRVRCVCGACAVRVRYVWAAVWAVPCVWAVLCM